MSESSNLERRFLESGYSTLSFEYCVVFRRKSHSQYWARFEDILSGEVYTDGFSDLKTQLLETSVPAPLHTKQSDS